MQGQGSNLIFVDFAKKGAEVLEKSSFPRVHKRVVEAARSGDHQRLSELADAHASVSQMPNAERRAVAEAHVKASLHHAGRGDWARSKAHYFMAEAHDRHVRSQSNKALSSAGVEKAADKLPGGRADDKSSDDFDEGSLREGAKHEKEHTDDPALAREIAMDHLAEDPRYYEKLKQVEKADSPSMQALARASNKAYYDGYRARSGAALPSAVRDAAMKHVASGGQRSHDDHMTAAHEHSGLATQHRSSARGIAHEAMASVHTTHASRATKSVNVEKAGGAGSRGGVIHHFTAGGRPIYVAQVQRDEERRKEHEDRRKDHDRAKQAKRVQREAELAARKKRKRRRRPDTHEERRLLEHDRREKQKHVKRKSEAVFVYFHKADMTLPKHVLSLTRHAVSSDGDHTSGITTTAAETAAMGHVRSAMGHLSAKEHEAHAEAHDKAAEYHRLRGNKTRAAAHEHMAFAHEVASWKGSKKALVDDYFLVLKAEDDVVRRGKANASANKLSLLRVHEAALRHHIDKEMHGSGSMQATRSALAAQKVARAHVASLAHLDEETHGRIAQQHQEWGMQAAGAGNEHVQTAHKLLEQEHGKMAGAFKPAPPERAVAAPKAGGSSGPSAATKKVKK